MSCRTAVSVMQKRPVQKEHEGRVTVSYSDIACVAEAAVLLPGQSCSPAGLRRSTASHPLKRCRRRATWKSSTAHMSRDCLRQMAPTVVRDHDDVDRVPAHDLTVPDPRASGVESPLRAPSRSTGADAQNRCYGRMMTGESDGGRRRQPLARPLQLAASDWRGAHLLHGLATGLRPRPPREWRYGPTRHPSIGRFPTGCTSGPTLSRGRLRLPYRAIGQLRALSVRRRPYRRAPALSARREDRPRARLASRRARAQSRKRVGSGSPPFSNDRMRTPVLRSRLWRRSVSGLASSCRPTMSTPSTRQSSAREEREYELADAILCPSDFVVRTFLDRGTSPEKLVRHVYGYDETEFFPAARAAGSEDGLTMLYVGVAAVRKGLHFALEAWLRSPASQSGTFLIAGEVLPAYGERLKPALDHPSVRVLGHRTDVADPDAQERRTRAPEHQGPVRARVHRGDRVGLRSARLGCMHRRVPPRRELPRP